MKKIENNAGRAPEKIKNMIKINPNNEYDDERLQEYLIFFGKDTNFIKEITKEYSIDSIEFKTKCLYPNFFEQMNTNEEIFDSYSKASELYSLRHLMGRPNKFNGEIEIFNFMQRKLHNLAIVMDYGCCVGDFSILFSRMGFQVIALDLDIPTFSFAKQRFKNRNLKIKTYSVSSNMHPPKLDAKVNFIFCRDVLEHTVNPLEVLQYFYDNLDNNGYMYISTMNPDDKIYIGAEHLEKTIKLVDTKEYKEFFNQYFINMGIHGLYKKKVG